MRIAMMQPYLFPYIGYFQLLVACDHFLLVDDVQYIAGGWINRNRILVNGAARWLTMPVAASGHRQPIDSRRYLLADRLAGRFRRQIEHAYRGAPYFTTTMDLIDSALSQEDANVATFNQHALQCVAAHLGIRTPIRRASSLPDPGPLAGQARVIERCRQLGATSYINPAGGAGLYDEALFAQSGIELRFMEARTPPYPQFEAVPVPGLSILDVLMFNDGDSVRRMLDAPCLRAAGSTTTSEPHAAGAR